VSARAALVFAAIAMSGSAIADEFGGPDRPKHEWPDGPNRDFLKNLQRPDNHKIARSYMLRVLGRCRTSAYQKRRSGKD
jgi:hypothetical protein